MPRALNLLRSSPHYRREAFDSGLQAAGYKVVPALPKPQAGDVLLVWNRYGGTNEQAQHFERCGATVLVAENSPLGNDLNGGSYSLARRHVALTGGEIREGGADRWDGWGIRLQPWRTGPGETVILAQRGIGHPEAASPAEWAEAVQRQVGGRIRQHPGTGPALALADDLAGAARVVTWSSAAALQALAMGVPVWHAHPAFLGAGASRPLSQWQSEARREDAARLAVFQRLAWAIWTHGEIRSGEAIQWATGAA